MRAPGEAPGMFAGEVAMDELAVMVDTFRPLDLGEGGLACDDGKYHLSWSGNRGGRAAGEVHSID